MYKNDQGVVSIYYTINYSKCIPRKHPAITKERKNRVVEQPPSKCILNSRVQDSHFVSRFSSSAFREGSPTRSLRQERASRPNGSWIQDRSLDFQRWTRSSWSTPPLRTVKTSSCRSQQAARLGTASTRSSDWRTTKGVIRKWRITLATRRKTQVTFAAIFRLDDRLISLGRNDVVI